MKLTIFTPTYNRAYILGQLYQSLIRQTCHDFEWLIVDDGSADDTEALVPAALCGLHFECLYFGQQAIRTLPREEASSILKRLKNTLAEHPIGADLLSSQKLSHRVWLQLANVSLPTACRIRNLLRIGC